MIKVAVSGALGRMGQEVVKAVSSADDMELVAVIDVMGANKTVAGLEVCTDLEQALTLNSVDAVVDFTQPDSVFENIKIALNAGVRPVIGTTGLANEQLAEVEALSKEKGLGCLIAPNFTVGAVLMMMFAAQASKYFKNAEIIELHHNQKKDAPSGTAIKTAQMMAEVQPSFAEGNIDDIELIEGSRGGKAPSDIQIHSVRMPGYMASQEVIFGSPGEIFKIRHDSVDRECYMAGVLLGIRHVFDKNDFVYGLDNIL